MSEPLARRDLVAHHKAQCVGQGEKWRAKADAAHVGSRTRSVGVELYFRFLLSAAKALAIAGALTLPLTALCFLSAPEAD